MRTTIYIIRYRYGYRHTIERCMIVRRTRFIHKRVRYCNRRPAQNYTITRQYRNKQQDKAKPIYVRMHRLPVILSRNEQKRNMRFKSCFRFVYTLYTYCKCIHKLRWICVKETSLRDMKVLLLILNNPVGNGSKLITLKFETL